MSFRLEALLRVRKNEENRVQRALGEIQTRIVAGQNRLDGLAQSGRDAGARLNGKYAQPFDASTLRLYDDYFNGLVLQDRTERHTLKEAGEVAEQRRQELVAAVTRRRTLEFLKEQQLQRERREAHRREIAVLDDIASRQWHTRSS